MKDIKELSLLLGPIRKRELKEAQAAATTAKAKLVELQETLAKQKESQAALAPATLVTAGANVATLAQGLQLTQAHATVIEHLERVEIPQATREVQRTASDFNKLLDAHARKQQYIEEQQRIIAKAQAEIDKAAAWLDS